MPPFSTDDYYKLLQKIAVLETKILRLEVNMEVNGQYGNETTLPMTQRSGKEQANRQMLCAKPKQNSCKDKSLPSDRGRRLPGRTQHLETRDDTEWPVLPSHRRVSSTPVPRRKQPWNVAKTKSKSKPTKDTWILLENRFAPLLQDPDSPKERSSSSTGERYEAKSYTKRLQKELTTGPQTLIVGDGAVNKTKHFFSKNTKVLCFTNDMVSDISEKILEITAEHPTVKSLVIHTGALDVVKQQSEVLKRDFNDLLNKVRCLNPEVFISGPLPTVRRGDERFSKLLMLNRWLKDTCVTQSVNFIDNFNIFWERRHLFEADGFCLNKSGVQLLSYNIFDFLRQSPAAPAKDKRRDNQKQQIRQPSGEKLLPPEIRIRGKGPERKPLRWRVAGLPCHTGAQRGAPPTRTGHGRAVQAALEPPAAAKTATPAPAPPERQRRPAEERGGSAATATGNRLSLASPGSSLEQPRPAAPLPGDQEPKAPCSRRRWEGSCLVALVEGGDAKTVPGPPRATSAAQLSGLLQNPSSQPLQPATPRDTSASWSSSPRPPVSGTEGEGVEVWQP
ncbi:hypothetical protein N1851_008116 [Merluccius polli]|uniref:Uncharacterized protein n=1 Tax=Merluccius polli TaxID=89951 RepID=A0AA47N1P8_MERPO|nr:hypothetical protein N1851_008116 [Merluccius polli]